MGRSKTKCYESSSAWSQEIRSSFDDRQGNFLYMSFSSHLETVLFIHIILKFQIWEEFLNTIIKPLILLMRKLKLKRMVWFRKGDFHRAKLCSFLDFKFCGLFIHKIPLKVNFLKNYRPSDSQDPLTVVQIS